jgi:hypothetical protein
MEDPEDLSWADSSSRCLLRLSRSEVPRAGRIVVRGASARSISAPARNVRSPEPNVARKSIHGALWIPNRLPARIPTAISISATEIPILMEMMLARRAKPIHTLATSQTLESTQARCLRVGGTRGMGGKKQKLPLRLTPSRSHQPLILCGT